MRYLSVILADQIYNVDVLREVIKEYGYLADTLRVIVKISIDDKFYIEELPLDFVLEKLLFRFCNRRTSFRFHFKGN